MVILITTFLKQKKTRVRRTKKTQEKIDRSNGGRFEKFRNQLLKKFDRQTIFLVTTILRVKIIK